MSNESESATQFEEKIRPLLVKYCIECHALGEMEGLDFLAALTENDVAKHRYLYAGVAEQMDTRAMPPKDFAQPTDRERKLVTDWLKTTLDLKPSDTDRISQYVVEAYEDTKRNLWFGTMHDGAARFDVEKRLTYFSKKDGLPGNVVSSFAEDKEGNQWAGGHAGISKFDGKKFTRLGSAVGLPDAGDPSPIAWAAVQADRKKTFGPGSVRRCFALTASLFPSSNCRSKRTKLNPMPSSREVLRWIRKIRMATCGLAPMATVHLDMTENHSDKHGTLWFGFSGGLFRFNGKTFFNVTKSK